MGLFKNFINLGHLSVRTKDAEAGDAKAQFHLGLNYQLGQLGLPLDFAEAAKWYRRAAIQGHAGAQLYLGVILAQGQGVEPDFIEAYKWIELAKQGSDLDKTAALESQNQLVAYMTPEQIAEGQRRAAQFSPTKRKK